MVAALISTCTLPIPAMLSEKVRASGANGAKVCVQLGEAPAVREEVGRLLAVAGGVAGKEEGVAVGAALSGIRLVA